MLKKQMRQPVTGGYARNVPVVMQMEMLECGAACLTMILAYYGKWLPLEQVREACGVSRNGSNAKNILIAARSYGLKAKGYRNEPEQLRKSASFPCIIHWNFNHFVVLNGFKGDKALLNDPARGSYAVPMDVFDCSFTGIYLMFEPDEGFVADGKSRSVFSFAKKRLEGAGTAMLFMLLTSLITVLLGIIQPAFSRIFLDRLLTGQNPDWAVPFLIAMSLLAIVQLIAGAVQAIYSTMINGKLAAVGSTIFLWKVLHMPMQFFSQRMAGDIQSRQSSNTQIAGELVNTFAPLVLDAVMMVFYLAVMLRYSWVLTLVGVGSIAINLLLAQLISRKRINITRVEMRDAGKLASTTVSGIEMIETIKASGAENGYFARWAGYQASVNTQKVRYARLNQMLGMLPTLVSSITGNAVLLLGAWFAMNGNFTVGMVMAFQGFLSSFTAPATKLITAGQNLQELRTDMERVEDVMRYPDDECFSHVNAGAEQSYGKLSGRVELKNVTFGYSRLDAPLIENFNMTLEPGSKIAIVGPSGCGKSTLAKLISGLYQPWSGEILVDGKPLKEIDRDVFTGSVAVVDQDVVLFEDTIANNIKMWDSSIEDFEMILAARDAQIHDDIMQRNGGYDYRLSEGGRDFSGGQRQRLEIARVLAQDPTIIIMDEATSALDAKTEFEVVQAVARRGISCIVIAHRLSTIRDCDEIIVLNSGKVVERGAHSELIALNGAYAALVTNE